MDNKIIITKDTNKDGKEIITKIENTVTYQLNNESSYKSTFYYEVSKDSKIFKESNVDTIVMSIEHGNPIKYKHFHEDLMIIDWALGQEGYDFVSDSNTWKHRLSSDMQFKERISELISSLIPITKEKYKEIQYEV